MAREKIPANTAILVITLLRRMCCLPSWRVPKPKSNNESYCIEKTGCSADTYDDSDATTDSICKLYSRFTGILRCCTCTNGITDCIACLPGQYSDANGTQVCDDCLAGTYQDEEGATDCKDCAGGTYQDEEGQDARKECLIGTYNNATGSDE